MHKSEVSFFNTRSPGRCNRVPGKIPNAFPDERFSYFLRADMSTAYFFHGNIDMYLSSKKDFESIEFVIAEINSVKVENIFQNWGGTINPLGILIFFL